MSSMDHGMLGNVVQGELGNRWLDISSGKTLFGVTYVQVDAVDQNLVVWL